MQPKNWLKAYFTFTQKDRLAAVLFVLVVAGSIILPRLLAKTPPPLKLQQDPVLLAATDTLQRRQQSRRPGNDDEAEGNTFRYEPTQAQRFSAGELFEFDPNTASFSDWQRLGLNDRTSRTILKYVSKGGKFYKPEDLLKIWGMPEGFYDRVKNYVKITAVTPRYPSFENKPYERKERAPLLIDINLADTSAFIALPGIGSRLSARIVNFREKLGGFYSVEQIGETWGLPDSTFQKIKGRLQLSGDVRKISVNTATKDELKTHPYIRWNLANAIVEYRNQHGPFRNLDELKNIVLMDEETFRKVMPYLSL